MKDTLLEFWYRALRTPEGICIRSTNPYTTKSYLYRVRRDAGDPSIIPLCIVSSPDSPDELWIIHERPVAGNGASYP